MTNLPDSPTKSGNDVVSFLVIFRLDRSIQFVFFNTNTKEPKHFIIYARYLTRLINLSVYETRCHLSSSFSESSYEGIPVPSMPAVKVI